MLGVYLSTSLPYYLQMGTLAWPASLRNLSALQCWSYRHTQSPWVFMWVLGTQTQVMLFAWQVPSPTKPVPRPLVTILRRLNPNWSCGKMPPMLSLSDVHFRQQLPLPGGSLQTAQDSKGTHGVVVYQTFLSEVLKGKTHTLNGFLQTFSLFFFCILYFFSHS